MQKISEEMMADNFPKLTKPCKFTKIGSSVNSKQNKPQKSMPKYTIIKFLKNEDNEKYWKQREKNDALLIQFEWLRISQQSQEGSGTIFKCWKKTVKSRTLYPVKITFVNEGKIKTFSKRGKLKECTASRFDLKELPKEVL